MDEQQLEKIHIGKGFIAALDQSGGSTPNALAAYGIARDAYSTDEEMFDLMQNMRSRIALSPAFDGDRILGAILFEDSLHREVGGQPFADYLWSAKRIVPFLKVDRGLAPVDNGVQLMKPIPDLATLLALGSKGHVFGTKMRSFVQLADAKGIAGDRRPAIRGGPPDSRCWSRPDPRARDLHREPREGGSRGSLEGSRPRAPGASSRATQRVIVKLTLPEVDDFYAELVQHPAILRVVALSGGYTRAVADDRLARNHGVIASFSRALTTDCGSRWMTKRSTPPSPIRSRASSRPPSPEPGPELRSRAGAQIPACPVLGLGSYTCGISALGGIRPRRPASKSSIACWISALVFMTKGP